MISSHLKKKKLPGNKTPQTLIKYCYSTALRPGLRIVITPDIQNNDRKTVFDLSFLFWNFHL